MLEYRQVAVVEDFYNIIRSVHITERKVHVGQKKTYRAVSIYAVNSSHFAYTLAGPKYDEVRGV